jgi:hypothetical protein
LAPSKNLQDSIRLLEAAAEELERAAEHCRTAAAHFTAREVPRAAAHAWAATGHLRTAQDSLDEQARIHASTSNP